MALNVPEKPERLRRQPVSAARPAMQRVKSLNGLQAAAEINLQTRRLRFADALSDGGVEMLKKDFDSGGKIDYMTVK
jgi:hypothetical protein